MKLRTVRISISVLMALMVQSGYGAPSTFAKALRLAVHGDRKAAVQTVIDNGQGHCLRVIDPAKEPTEVKKEIPIVEKVIEEEPQINLTREIEVQTPFFNIAEIKKQIEQHEVISFDIFDTLLLRPYVNPWDLIVHLERLENAPGFVQARVEASQKARRKHPDKEDVSFDEIYAEIDPKFIPLKNKEMALERLVLTANPEMKEAFDYALQQGKRVVITSDMYLPASFLQQVLEEKGYMGFHKIYVSGDLGKVKGSGHLFDYLLQDENIENVASVLHIGDNEHCDKNMAEKKGIFAIWYQKRIDKLFSENKRAKIFYDKHRNELDASILLGMLALSNPTGNYWYDFGYTYAGPTILGYMKWLDKQVQKDGRKEILFVARDGYTPEKVFNIIKTDENIRTHYVYMSRMESNRILSGDEKVRQKIANYLNQFRLKDEKLIFVDSRSARLTNQRALTLVLSDKDIAGCYTVFFREYYSEHIDDSLEKYDIRTYQSGYEQTKNWLLMESIFSAPKPTVKAIDDNGDPVFQIPSENDVKRIEIYPHISGGAVRFAQTYIDIFDKKDIYFSSNMLASWLNIFCDIPMVIDKQHFVDLTLSNIPIMSHWYN